METKFKPTPLTGLSEGSCGGLSAPGTRRLLFGAQARVVVVMYKIPLERAQVNSHFHKSKQVLDPEVNNHGKQSLKWVITFDSCFG